MKRRSRLQVGLGLAACLALAPSVLRAATVTIASGDPAGVGFNDPTPVAPVGGNSGTTLGQQRMIAFQAAANKWAATLASNVVIRVTATWTAMSLHRVLPRFWSRAGPTEIFKDFAGAPVGGHWYAKALANKIAGIDLDGNNVDITANFNINLGQSGCLSGLSFYLGLDNNHGGNIDLVAVVTHELAHGLGYQTFTDGQSGAQLGGAPSIWDDFLLDNTTNKTWTMMTAAERVASAVNNGHLVWNGGNVSAAIPLVLQPQGSSYTGADPQGRGLMYAPGSYLAGSSISHFDTSMFRNQLMEPAINGDLTHEVTPPYDLTFSLLKDIGWTAGSVTVPALTISKTHTGNFTQGQTGAAYTLTVSNQAGAGATSGTVTVTETVPSGLTLMSMAGTGWTCPGGNTCTRGDVLNGGAGYPAIAVTVNVAATAPSLVTNQASVSGGGSATANASDNTAIAAVSSVPGQVTLTSPGSGAANQSTTPTLSWSASTSATSYDLYLGTSNPPAVYAQNLSGTSYAVSTALTAGTTYYWNVVAKNGVGSAPASSTWSFVTASLSTSVGLIGYWNFDEGSGSIAHDTSGGGHNGTVNGAVWTTGKINTGLRFNGTTNSVITPAIALGGPFSVSAWVNPSVTPQVGYVRIAETYYASGFYLGTDTTGTKYKLIVNGGAGVTGSCGYGCAEGGTITSGWHLVTATFDGATAQLYVDNAVAGSDTFTAPSNINLPLYIGISKGGGYGWNGTIDEVRLYNRGLSSAEVSAIYNNTGAPRTPRLQRRRATLRPRRYRLLRSMCPGRRVRTTWGWRGIGCSATAAHSRER